MARYVDDGKSSHSFLTGTVGLSLGAGISLIDLSGFWVHLIGILARPAVPSNHRGAFR